MRRHARSLRSRLKRSYLERRILAHKPCEECEEPCGSPIARRNLDEQEPETDNPATSHVTKQSKGSAMGSHTGHGFRKEAQKVRSIPKKKKKQAMTHMTLLANCSVEMPATFWLTLVVCFDLSEVGCFDGASSLHAKHHESCGKISTPRRKPMVDRRLEVCAL